MYKILLIAFLITQLFAVAQISPIEDKVNVNKDKAVLGKMLFFEKRLSKDNTLSCASCHILTEGGDDNKAISKGVNNKKGSVNTPTIFNVKYNFTQFWDGRAQSLKEQAKGPIHNPVEMGSNMKEVIQKLKKDRTYLYMFRKVYQSKIKSELIYDAIVEYEKTLITPNSRFDLFLKGDKTALNKDEKRGYELFISYGCISCHNGVNMGGNLFQKMGIFKNKTYEGNKYLGRYNVTKNEEDKYYYKVPTLRNIELTAPYFHNGQTKDLKSAVSQMMEYQLGINPKDEDIDTIIVFLKTLNGTLLRIEDIQ